MVSRDTGVHVTVVVLALAGLAVLFQFVSDPLGPLFLDGLLAGLAGVIAVAYLILEACAGYRESSDGAGT